jgi:hypothetical protein
MDRSVTRGEVPETRTDLDNGLVLLGAPLGYRVLLPEKFGEGLRQFGQTGYETLVVSDKAHE